MSAPAPAGSVAPRVLVVGAGISGIACARELSAAGVQVQVRDRGRRAGGRLGSRTLDLPGGGRHVVDTGAAYLTARDPEFSAVVADWAERGLARPWTDTFAVLHPDGAREPTTGPQRWAAPQGLRTLVDDLAGDLDVVHGATVRSVDLVEGRPAADGEPVDAVVLAMPDPQAGRLLAAGGELPAVRARLAQRWEAVITVYALWQQRWWPDLDAAFVADDPLLSLVADDGRRRGDGAPVLVAHSTAEAAAEHLGDPDALVAPVLERLGALLGGGAAVPPPVTASAHRWSFASPVRPHEEPHLLTPAGRGLLGVCGDGWGERPRVEQAWRSGTDLGRALAERLAA